MKKLLTILILIMLIISFFQITKMYALYKDKIAGEYNTSIGKWEVKVNNTNLMSTGQIENFTIADNQLGYVESEHIQAGKIAPGGQAYFDIVIDSSNTDVSIIYQIDIESIEQQTVTQASAEAETSTEANIGTPAKFEITKAENYFQKDGETEKITNDTTYKTENSYISVIPVTQINQGFKNYVRLYFKWVNVEDNNQTDSTLAQTENAKLAVPLKMTLRQYTGEVIGNGT